MTNKKTQVRMIMILAGVVFIALLVYLSRQQNQNQYEVCVTFKGAMHCATAAGATPTEAIRSAQGIDCELLSNGRDENMVCLEAPPSSVRPMNK
jgi:Na+/glutamate symporter